MKRHCKFERAIALSRIKQRFTIIAALPCKTSNAAKRHCNIMICPSRSSLTTLVLILTKVLFCKTWNATNKHWHVLKKPSRSSLIMQIPIIIKATHSETRSYEQALLSFKHAIMLNPNFVEAFNNLGITYQSLKQYELALECHERVIAIQLTMRKLIVTVGFH